MDWILSISGTTWFFIGILIWAVLFLQILKMVSLTDEEKKLEQDLIDYEEAAKKKEV